MNLRYNVIALGVGILGASIGVALSLPAGALLGSTVAVTLAALARLKPQIPVALRDMGFCVIGVGLGAGVTPEVFTQVAKWPLSIFILALTICAIMALSSYLLCRFFGASPATALLATAPGGISYSVTMASEGYGDVRIVTVLQGLRLLLVTLLLPPIISVIDGGLPLTGSLAEPQYMSYSIGITLLLIAFAMGYGLSKIGMPAAYLLAGLVLSGILHGIGVIEGRLEAPITFIGFSIAGAAIGARLSGISMTELRQLGGAAFLATITAVAISAIGATLVITLFAMPFGQAWVAFAPGGVEGMASMALALGYAPVFVAAHHVFRIVFLIICLPTTLRFLPKTAQSRESWQ